MVPGTGDSRSRGLEQVLGHGRRRHGWRGLSVDIVVREAPGPGHVRLYSPRRTGGGLGEAEGGGPGSCSLGGGQVLAQGSPYTVRPRGPGGQWAD